MDIQTKKLYLVQEFLRLNDEVLIDKLNDLLKLERRKRFEQQMKPMSVQEFNSLIDRAEDDAENGKLTSTQALLNKVDSWH